MKKRFLPFAVLVMCICLIFALSACEDENQTEAASETASETLTEVKTDGTDDVSDTYTETSSDTDNGTDSDTDSDIDTDIDEDPDTEASSGTDTATESGTDTPNTEDTDEEGTEAVACDHSYGEAWQNNASSHWLECSKCQGKKDLAKCADADADHKCDVCKKLLTVCADTDSDHKCDVCQVKLTNCVFNGTHTCLLCKQDSGACADNNDDHKCDICKKVLTVCADNDNDHNCDLCGAKCTDHTGGTATCTEKAVCSICNEEYGSPLNHSYGAGVNNGDGTHTRTCANDSTHTVTEDCSGGTAICNGKATCEFCGEQYGEVLGHSYGDWVGNGDGTHTKTCAKDSTHTVTEDCNGGNATCEGKATCSDCGEQYGDVLGHSYGNWVSKNGTHVKTCANDSTHTLTENCSGGTATCSSKAVCTVCRGSYGSLESHNFDLDNWTKTTDKHYHACKNTSCTAKTGEATHSFSSGYCTVCGAKKAYGTEGLEFSYSADTDSYTVTKYKGSDTVVIIPDVYDDYTHGEKPVKAIGDRAFYELSAVTSVTLPKNLVSIGGSAFNRCSGLTSITLPSSVRTIGKMAFFSAGLTSITIPEGVTEIGERTFGNCDDLESVTLPASLTDISGISAFGSCPKLGVINFNGTVSQWKSVNIASDTWWYSAEHIYPYEDWKIVCRDGEVKRFN